MGSLCRLGSNLDRSDFIFSHHDVSVAVAVDAIGPAFESVLDLDPAAALISSFVGIRSS